MKNNEALLSVEALKIEDSYLQATEIISAESESLDCKILANQHVKLNTEKQK